MMRIKISVIILITLYFQITTQQMQERDDEVMVSGSKKTIKELINVYFPEFISISNKSCIEEAISYDGFLSRCIHGDDMSLISDTHKMIVSIKLTICEFENSASIRILQPCLYHISDERNSKSEYQDRYVQFMDCMVGNSNEFWTSYSGYYQRLNSLCFENEEFYNKERFFNMINNVTNFFEDFNYEMHEMNEDFNVKNFNRMQEYVDDIFDGFVDLQMKQNSVLEDDFNKFRNQMNENLNKNDLEYQLRLSKREMELRDYFLKVNDIIKDISSSITREKLDIKDEIQSFKNQIIANASNEMVSYEIEKNLENEKKLQEVLLTTSEGLVMINELVNDTVRNFQGQLSGELIESITSSIELELMPSIIHFKQIMLKEMSMMTSILNDEMKHWNYEITNNFENINMRIIDTMEKINDLDSRLNKFIKALNGLFASFTKLLQLVKLMWAYKIIMILVFLIISQRTIWRRVLIKTLTLPKMFIRLLRLMLKWLMLIVVIIFGSQFGKFIIASFI
ncbi:Kar5p NDAI_0G04500 [Naumovozyma dairenensis CBS 421]|uniref:Nuclear fusion protein KAR5 n=1 Tax=Naumovozyma dairenensis (strain ATCC 10597 / BCRC 20456 / CBS 421 / NBRC 0211 / NRRL Y-12639) TaxID=1071378 RepID=J7SBN6_NAUDC|nr:hypothetical protein NDAI_0G04500 [Naumovozyma dairenensis CBS 421]CCK73435.1 hypothetical protein NDAI_0G04500 [Naumovozyma dairenensis CBS 421]